MAGLVFKITIEDTHPPVWRRIIFPEQASFQDLHDVIQTAFGWDDDHLHIFKKQWKIPPVSSSKFSPFTFKTVAKSSL